MSQEPTKTVYFLGAGASAASDFKLPVMQGFFDEKDFPENGGKYSNLRTFFKQLYPDTKLADINLEEVITHLELTLEGFNWGFSDSSLLDAKKELYKYIRYRFYEPPKDKICEKHLKLIKNIKQESDSIISLNYDLVVDDILRKEFKVFLKQSDYLLSLGISGIDHPIHPISDWHIGKGVYIKLHGSLNWIYCPSSDCINNSYFWPYADNLKEPCNACGANLEEVIVPPTMKKSFEKFPKLGFLWHVAFDKLKTADRIITIGMSFPDSDYYLKWLVRQAMIERQTNNSNLPKLIVVNPKKADRGKNAQVFGISPDKELDGLDDYLKTI